MENKINILNLLRDCPTGMELDCTMFEDIEFDNIVDNEYFPIRCRIKDSNDEYNFHTFTKYGRWNNDDKAKCVIFPKGKTTWEGFHRPFIDGDILATNDGKFIAIIKKNGGKYYCCCHTNGNYFITDYSGWFDRFATEEEKQKLFDIIKDNGYHWNAKKKILEELPKFKDGDVVVAEDSESFQLFLLKKYLNKDNSSHNGYCYFGWNINYNELFEKGNWRFDRLATKEEKEKLFQTIKDNGYHWDEVTKTLKKLPIFKVGDRIKHKDSGLHCTLGNYSEGISAYRTNIGLAITPKDLEQWELVPNKFDINTLKPFDKVLVRDFDNGVWEIDFFSRLLGGRYFKCLDLSHVQCIPYKGNEHLYGTTNSCDDYFKTWEK